MEVYVFNRAVGCSTAGGHLLSRRGQPRDFPMFDRWMDTVPFSRLRYDHAGGKQGGPSRGCPPAPGPASDRGDQRGARRLVRGSADGHKPASQSQRQSGSAKSSRTAERAGGRAGGAQTLPCRATSSTTAQKGRKREERIAGEARRTLGCRAASVTGAPPGGGQEPDGDGWRTRGRETGGADGQGILAFLDGRSIIPWGAWALSSFNSRLCSIPKLT